MPDGLIHAASTVWAVPLLREPRLRWILYAGAILPDVVMKTMTFLFDADWRFAAAAHSLLGVALVAYLTAHLWPESERPSVCLALLAGGALHLAVDALQDPQEGWGVFLLLPFDRTEFALGWFTDAQALRWAPAAAAALLLVELALRHAQPRR
jgi:membrane-bound metal-dependent hydrolase YbcI (DUF457 family)